MSRDHKKDAMKKRKDQKEIELQEKVSFISIYYIDIGENDHIFGYASILDYFQMVVMMSYNKLIPYERALLVWRYGYEFIHWVTYEEFAQDS